jgi:hypothetical protein
VASGRGAVAMERKGETDRRKRRGETTRRETDDLRESIFGTPEISMPKKI